MENCDSAQHSDQKSNYWRRDENEEGLCHCPLPHLKRERILCVSSQRDRAVVFSDATCVTYGDGAPSLGGSGDLKFLTTHRGNIGRFASWKNIVMSKHLTSALMSCVSRSG